MPQSVELDHVMSFEEMKSFAHECLKQAKNATDEGSYSEAVDLLTTAGVLLNACEGKEVTMRLSMNSQ